MPLSHLTDAEKAVVGECLSCVASGEIIQNDWEFQTLFGIEFGQLQAVAAAWPHIDEADKIVFLAINNSLNNLVGYPHGGEALWSKHISVPPSEVLRVLKKWRGNELGGYFEGLE